MNFVAYTPDPGKAAYNRNATPSLASLLLRDGVTGNSQAVNWAEVTHSTSVLNKQYWI